MPAGLTWPDAVNGAFEFWGGIAIWRNATQLYRDKTFKGVRLDSTVFFTAWGFWNVWYYPHLDQTLSFLAGLFIVSGNVAWLSLMFYYRRHPGGGPRTATAASMLDRCTWPDCRICKTPCDSIKG